MKRTFDIGSAIGLFLAIGLILFGIVTNTDSETRKMSVNVVNLMSFFDPASMLIVLGGVIGCLLIMFPLSQFKKIPKQLQIIFQPRIYNPMDYINFLVDSAKKARTSGLLSLEENIAAADDSFLKKSLQMIVDSVDPEKVKNQMESWMEDLDDRHYKEYSFYDKGAALGPAFGMIGTLIGLVNMLKNLEDIATVGPNMAVALITTFYGSFIANVIFTPISTKLRVRHDEEMLCKQIVSVGIQAIQAGENPNMINERLLHILPDYQKTKMSGEGEDGKKGKKEKKEKKEKAPKKKK